MSRSDFESKWRSNWSLTIKPFVYSIDNLDCFMLNFGYFSDAFDNIKFFSLLCHLHIAYLYLYHLE